ncbi:hypothetical protein BH09CHL1_BH09CHL1_11980 [soil metagenome]
MPRKHLLHHQSTAINLEEVFSSVAWGRNPRAAGHAISEIVALCTSSFVLSTSSLYNALIKLCQQTNACRAECNGE